MVVQRYKQSFCRRKYMVLHCKVGWRWDKEVGCKASVDHNTTIPRKRSLYHAIRCKRMQYHAKRGWKASVVHSLRQEASRKTPGISPRETLGIFVAFFVLVIFIFVLVVFTTVRNCVSREQIVEQYIVDWLKPRKT